MATWCSIPKRHRVTPLLMIYLSSALGAELMNVEVSHHGQASSAEPVQAALTEGVQLRTADGIFPHNAKNTRKEPVKDEREVSEDATMMKLREVVSDAMKLVNEEDSKAQHGKNDRSSSTSHGHSWNHQLLRTEAQLSSDSDAESGADADNQPSVAPVYVEPRKEEEGPPVAAIGGLFFVGVVAAGGFWYYNSAQQKAKRKSELLGGPPVGMMGKAKAPVMAKGMMKAPPPGAAKAGGLNMPGAKAGAAVPKGAVKGAGKGAAKAPAGMAKAPAGAVKAKPGVPVKAGAKSGAKGATAAAAKGKGKGKGKATQATPGKGAGKTQPKMTSGAAVAELIDGTDKKEELLVKKQVTANQMKAGGMFAGWTPEEMEKAIRAAIKIQSVWRGRKVRNASHLSAAVKRDGERYPSDGQRIIVVVEVKNAVDVPSVNTFGGCDPFIQGRILNSDPMAKKEGGTQEVPEAASQTESKSNDMSPHWNERLELKAIYSKEKHFQLVLWDYNIVKNAVVGHISCDVPEAIDGVGYNALKMPDPLAKEWHFWKIEDGQTEPSKWKTKLFTNVCFWEVHKYDLKVMKGKRLPQTDFTGGADGFIEARAIKGDPRKLPWASSPGKECEWSGRTDTVTDTMDPVWNKDLTFTIGGDPDLHLQLILWDDNSPLPNKPLGHAVIPLNDVCSTAPGGKALEHKLQFVKLPDMDAPAELSKARVTISLGYDLVFNQ